MAASNGYTSLATVPPQGRWRRMWITAAVAVLCLFLYYAYSSDLALPYEKPESAPPPKVKQPPSNPVSQPSNPVSQHSSAAQAAPAEHNATETVSIPPSTPSSTASPSPPTEALDLKAMLAELSAGDIMSAMARPFVHPVDAANFTADGQTHFLAGEPRFKKGLGKKILILDVDSRPLDKEGHLNHPKMDWDNIKPLSAGLMSHHLYASIHGYDYQLIRAPDYEDRWGTWIKVPFMKEALKTHDYIVFLDSDVMFHYPHLPIEWLMNYWNMTKETLVMMSIDPDEPQNYDALGNRYLNTGFVIAQQSERTQEMYTRWAECPEETRYKGCSRFKKDWPHEQAAFGNYIRYDYDRPDDIRVLPCTEANGAPEAINRGGCKGTFVRHYWVDKSLLPKGLADFVMQHFVRRIYQSLHEEASGNMVDATGFRLEGANLIPLTDEEKAKLAKEGNKNQKDEGF